MSKHGRIVVAALAVWVAVLSSAPAQAHEKWFTDSSKFPITWGEAFSLKTVLVLLAVAAGLAAVYGLDWGLRTFWPNRLPRTVRLSQRQLERIFAWVPLLLGLHAAVPLIVSGLQLQLFAANLQLPRNFFGGVMGLLQITVALSFVYGALTRVFAVVLLALFPLGFLFFSPAYVLEHLDLAGVAVFLFITGRGPFSVDALIGSPAQPLVRYMKYAVPSLRILTGAAIVVLGFTEKIWNEQLAESFLAYQDFNFARPLGFSNEVFILLAGIVEILVGATLISGKLTRLVIATAWIPFNLTLPFLGWVELAGHFPVYGTMVVLLLWGAGQDLTPYLRTLRRARFDMDAGEPVSARPARIPS
ncbi:MAG: DoxX protein [Chloroflexota bacterium]|nr:DoxX protein [Chloroflexota bacterium]